MFSLSFFYITCVFPLQNTTIHCLSNTLCDLKSLVFMSLYTLFVIESAYIPFNTIFLFAEKKKKKAGVKYGRQY